MEGRSDDQGGRARLSYGAHSPFSEDERVTIEAVYREARDRPSLEHARREIEVCFDRLEALGDLLSRFPRTSDPDTLGTQLRDRSTLAAALCESSPSNFELRAPSRAIIGRALDVAEMNFYRLLWRICDELLEGSRADELRDQAAVRLRVTTYTMAVEDVLSAIVSDSGLEQRIRGRAVKALIEVWDRRQSYRVSDFFPVLQTTWEARHRIRVVGGTLVGTQEMFELFREGCDPKFVEFFTRPDPVVDEVEAFREFLFGKTAEQLDALSAEMESRGESTIALDSPLSERRAAGTLFYEFFRSRSLQAAARRLAGLPGPKRTAEGYVMVAYLGKD